MDVARQLTGVAEIANAVRSGRVSAVATVQNALDIIAAKNPQINAVTRTLADRALADATKIDALIANGQDAGALAGVPFGVKDLFDVTGLSTTAGAGRLRDAPVACADAEAVQRLQAAGAILVATCNMDEFAYGFVTDNIHWGLTRNPHDVERFAGGSSGGSAAAVASGMVAFALGSDTNGSIRIPASLCGLHGMKPTHESLPMAGVYPFVHSLDDIGAFTCSAKDLRIVDQILRSGDTSAAASKANVAMLGGWFRQNLSPEMTQALQSISGALNNPPTLVLQNVASARSAAFLITAYEGGRLHLDALRADPLSFDPATRDRLIAGAALPRDVYEEALSHHSSFDAQFDRAFSKYDVLIAATTFGPAPRIDDPVISIDEKPQPVRANLGLFTQPISFLGLPSLSVPLRTSSLPLGIQLIGRRGADAMLLSFAEELEARGLTEGRVAEGRALS
tara:strand:+ start:2825 stop:4180 length:1356 start_codon:yes stop_codon:yes gene_type:complete